MSGGGSPHLHSQFVRGCFRCEISRDEGDEWETFEELNELNGKLAAIRAEVEPWADRILRDAILVILDGPTP